MILDVALRRDRTRFRSRRRVTGVTLSMPRQKSGKHSRCAASVLMIQHISPAAHLWCDVVRSC